MKMAFSLMLALSGAGCTQEAERPYAREVDARQGGHGEDAPLTAAGTLQANWRVTRPGDPDDGAVMQLQIIHDGDWLQGSYVLFQPFCWIEHPLPQTPGDDCELTDLSADLEGVVRDDQARLVFRPGADGLEHILTFTASDADRIEGAYSPPGEETSVPVVLERQVF